MMWSVLKTAEMKTYETMLLSIIIELKTNFIRFILLCLHWHIYFL